MGIKECTKKKNGVFNPITLICSTQQSDVCTHALLVGPCLLATNTFLWHSNATHIILPEKDKNVFLPVSLYTIYTLKASKWLSEVYILHQTSQSISCQLSFACRWLFRPLCLCFPLISTEQMYPDFETRIQKTGGLLALKFEIFCLFLY